MASAIVLYQGMAPDFIENVVSPTCKQLGFNLTNYRCIGRVKQPEKVLISIKGQGERKDLIDMLKRLSKESLKIAGQEDEKSSKTNTDYYKMKCAWLHHYDVISSYANPDDADDTFKGADLEYAFDYVKKTAEFIKNHYEISEC